METGKPSVLLELLVSRTIASSHLEGCTIAQVEMKTGSCVRSYVFAAKLYERRGVPGRGLLAWRAERHKTGWKEEHITSPAYCVTCRHGNSQGIKSTAQHSSLKVERKLKVVGEEKRRASSED
jgi:hypothetical protein